MVFQIIKSYKHCSLLFILFVSCCFAFSAASAQRVYTKNGHIAFFSKSPLENISAENNEVTSIINVPTGELQFSVLIKSFRFKKSLMEEHFNENYLESDKYPKAVFKGTILNITAVNFTKDGNVNVQVSGNLTLHGITKPVISSGTITIRNGIATAAAFFKLRLADYNIKIPGIVKDNIAEQVDITVNCIYDRKL
ncbi:MAG: YceI family protein [Ferruginibacter sp.]|nr:YceI family protein [Ferruginibacter sp.]